MHFTRITRRLFDAILDYSERITSHLTSRNLEKQLNYISLDLLSND